MVKSVLAIGCDDRSGLAVIRSLGRARIAVDIAAPTGPSAIASRYVRDVVHLPDPSDSPQQWLVALEDLVARRKYDLIFPCSDKAVIPLQSCSHELGRLTRVYSLSERAFLTTYDKYQTTLLAERCGIRLPRWALVHSVADIASIVDDFPVPLVLKPLSSFNLRHAVTRRSVIRISNRADIAPSLAAMLCDSPVLVQAYFPGSGVGVELLAKDGVALAAFQHERIHEPPSGGGSSYRRSVPVDPRLLSAAEKIVGALGYTGLIMVEFRVNIETGDWILVETNGRVWGSLPLAINAGADFPRYLYEMLVEGRSDFPQSYRSGIYCRNITLDIGWLKSNFTADRRDPTQQVLPLRQILSELGNIWKLSERTDTFALDDPLPLFAELRGLAKRGAGYLLQKAAPTCRLSILFKHWRARAAIHKLKAAKKVVFVCYGNICRSPFAEAYARATAPSYMEFSSAGTFEDMGRCSPSGAIAAASTFHVDLAAHRSRVISAETIEAADAIIVFDWQNLRDILQKFPGAKDHIVLIGDFLPGLSDEITDPFGRPPEYFEDCYRKISGVLTRLARDYWSTPRLTRDYARNSLAAFHELGHPHDISPR